MNKIYISLFFICTNIFSVPTSDEMLTKAIKSFADDIVFKLSDIETASGRNLVKSLSFGSEIADISDLVTAINAELEKFNKNAEGKIGNNEALKEIKNNTLLEIQKILQKSTLSNKPALKGIINFISKATETAKPTVTVTKGPEKSIDELIKNYESQLDAARKSPSKKVGLDDLRTEINTRLDEEFKKNIATLEAAKVDHDLLIAAENNSVKLMKTINSLKAVNDPLLKRDLQAIAKRYSNQLKYIKESTGSIATDFLNNVKSFFGRFTDYFNAAGRAKRKLSSKISDIIDSINEELGEGQAGTIVAKVPAQPLQQISLKQLQAILSGEQAGGEAVSGDGGTSTVSGTPEQLGTTTPTGEEIEEEAGR